MLDDVGHGHRAVDGGGQAVDEADGDQLLRGAYEPVAKGHQSENGRADQQPEAPPPAVG